MLSLTTLIHDYGLFAVAAGTFLEGESVLLLAGAAAAHGHLSLPAVIGVAVLASFAGDQSFFWVGHRWGTALLARLPRLHGGVARMHALLARYHTPLILAIRFLYGLRIAGPIAIGISRIPWQRFFVLNLLGAMIWAPIVAGVGYGAGRAAALALQAIDADELLGVAALLLLGAAAWLLARRLHKRMRPGKAINAGDR